MADDNDVVVLAIAKLLEAGDVAGAERLKSNPELLDELLSDEPDDPKE